jgi:hypothetical protein
MVFDPIKHQRIPKVGFGRKILKETLFERY